jgi:hypothetical protein
MDDVSSERAITSPWVQLNKAYFSVLRRIGQGHVDVLFHGEKTNEKCIKSLPGGTTDAEKNGVKLDIV